MIELTARQHEYILEISACPKTIQELAEIVKVSPANVSKRMSELRDMGIVKSTWVTSERRRIYVHSLIRSYDDLVSAGLKVRHHDRRAVTLEEIYYAAILTSGNMTGLQKVAQYQKLYPHRTPASLKYISMKARNMRLCR